jgi:hypothetical protein
LYCAPVFTVGVGFICFIVFHKAREKEFAGDLPFSAGSWSLAEEVSI